MVVKYDEIKVIHIQSHFRGYLARRLYYLKKTKRQKEPNPILDKKIIIYGDHYFNVILSYCKSDDCYIVKALSVTYLRNIESLVVTYKNIDLDSYGPHTSKTKILASILLNYVNFTNNSL